VRYKLPSEKKEIFIKYSEVRIGLRNEREKKARQWRVKKEKKTIVHGEKGEGESGVK